MQFVPSASGKRFATVNPATGETIAEVAEAGRRTSTAPSPRPASALESGPWAAMKPRQRGADPEARGGPAPVAGRRVRQSRDADNGKPIFESAKIDMPAAAECLAYFGEYADKLYGDTFPGRLDAFLMTVREPIGVVGAITPWNFPLLQAMWKIAPALALGNAVVLKPASVTPLTALMFAELLAEAGLPPGAFNVVPGPGAVVGKAMAEHPGIDKISFTGETETGKSILRAAAGTVKRVSMELGGKSPNIVFADADLDAAARGAINGIFYGKGELCSAGSRLLVEESVHDALIEKVVERAKKMVPGDPLDPKTRLGSLVSEKQRENVARYVESGRKEGAKLVAGGNRASVNGKGAFFEATVFDGVTPADDDRAGRDLRPGARDADLQGRGGSGRDRQCHDLRPRGRRLVAGHQEGAAHGEGAEGRHGLDQHLQLLRPGPALRRLQGVRLRPRARPLRPRGVHAGQVDLGGSDLEVPDLRDSGSRLHGWRNRGALPLVLASLLSAPAASAPPAAAPSVKSVFESLRPVRHFHDTALAPDGARAAWSEKVADERRRGDPRRDLRRRPARRQAPPADRGRRQGASRVGRRLLPDGRTIAFLSDAAAPGQLQIWLAPAAGGPPRQLTRVKGQLEHLLWSADGRSIAFLFVEGSSQETGALVAYKPDSGVVQEAFEEQRIAVADAKTGQVRHGLPRRPLRLRLRLVARRATFAAEAVKGSGTDNYWVAELYRVDAATGRPARS